MTFWSWGLLVIVCLIVILILVKTVRSVKDILLLVGMIGGSVIIGLIAYGMAVILNTWIKSWTH